MNAAMSQVNEKSDQDQPLAGHGKRKKAGIIKVDVFTGVQAVFLCFFGGDSIAMNESESLEFSRFINDYLFPADGAGAESGGDSAECLRIHNDLPIDSQLKNFELYVREIGMTPEELRFVSQIGIKALAIVKAQH